MKYVCTGATLRCTMGTSCPKLKATPKNISLTGKDQANIADYVSIKNIPSFGRCRSLGYPPTAAATAANYGKLTPMPCVPGTCPKWQAIDKDSLICGEPALLEPATLRCMYGGTISIVNPGQSLEIKVRGVSFSQRSETQQEKAMQEIPEELLQEFNALDRERLSQQSVLDGVQMALDVAGMAPGVGAIPDLMNAAISVLRGDWVGAGLSIVAAVPGVGDVVGGAKIAYRGAHIAKNAQEANAAVRKFDKIKQQSKPVVMANEARKTAERNIVELPPGKKGNWNKKLNELPMPNTDYKVGDKLYRTDETGKVRNISGKLKLGKIGERNVYQQTKTVSIKDGKKGDDGGHLIAHQFKGAGEQINYVPMLKNLNRGQWKKMEGEWQKALKQIPPKKVFVDINALYKAGSKRPLGFVVNYTIDGVPYRKKFRNFNLKKQHTL